MNARLKFGILLLGVFTWLALQVPVPSLDTGDLTRLLLAPLTGQQAQDGEPSGPEPLVLTGEQDQYPLGLYLELLEDPGGELTIDDVSSPRFEARFSPSQVEVPNFGYTDSVYWVRFRLDNQTHQTDEWLLEQGFANTHYLDLYTTLPDGGFTVKQTGVLRPVSTRDLIYPRIIFKLETPPGSQQTYYLRFQSGASITMPLTLWTESAFLDSTLVEQALMGIFFGVLIGLIFYNLFLLFTLRDVSYLYFVILMSILIFEEASYAGFLQVYFIPDLNIPVQYIQPVAFSLLIGSMVLFADSFLELKSRLPKLHAISLMILIIWGALVLMTPFASYRLLAYLGIPWGLISLSVILLAGIASWKGGFRPSRFFLLAWLGLVVSLFWVLLVRLGLASSTVLSENAFRMGYLWMAVCWSIALADRINLLKDETERANLELRSSEHKLTQILEGLPLGVVVYGPDQKPNFVNQRTAEILDFPSRGIRSDPAAGRTLAQAIDYFSFKIAGSDRAYPLENFPVYQALQGTPAGADDIEADRGDQRLPLEIWASPVWDEAGNVQSAIVAFRDISLQKQVEKALRTNEARFRVIAENNFDGIAFMGRDREVLYASPSYMRLVGKTAEELIGKSGIGLVHPDDREYTAKLFNEVLQQPNTRITAEYRIPHKDGSWIWVETFAINLLDNPDVRAVVLNSHDISERKQAEAELAEYRQNLERLVTERTAQLSKVNEQLNQEMSERRKLENVLFQRIAWLSTLNDVRQTLNGAADLPRAYQQLSTRIMELYAAGGVFVLRWDDQDERTQILSYARQSGSTLEHAIKEVSFSPDLPLRQELEQGHTIHLSAGQLAALPVPFDDCLREDPSQTLVLVPLAIRYSTIGVLGMVVSESLENFSQVKEDPLELIALDLAKLAYEADLLDKGRKLAVIDERSRLARDLHDSVTQVLFSAALVAEVLPQIWRRDPERGQQSLERLRILTHTALAEMRTLLLELRPTALTSTPLGELLAQLTEAVTGRSEVEFTLFIEQVPMLPEEVQTSFYRIAQEALNNVVKHAQAKQVTVNLSAAPLPADSEGVRRQEIRLVIRDDGVGFNLGTRPLQSLGIRIMRERAAAIGANLSLESRPGYGMAVELTWIDEMRDVP